MLVRRTKQRTSAHQIESLVREEVGPEHPLGRLHALPRVDVAPRADAVSRVVVSQSPGPSKGRRESQRAFRVVHEIVLQAGARSVRVGDAGTSVSEHHPVLPVGSLARTLREGGEDVALVDAATPLVPGGDGAALIGHGLDSRPEAGFYRQAKCTGMISPRSADDAEMKWGADEPERNGAGGRTGGAMTAAAGRGESTYNRN